MKNLRPEEENIIKDIRSLFRLKKLNYNPIKDVRNLFRLEIETKGIRGRILRNINFFLSMKKNVYNVYNIFIWNHRKKA